MSALTLDLQLSPQEPPVADEQVGTSPPKPDVPRDVKVIKRYTNRKLYDTVESRYVTLEEIAAMVKSGVEVQVLDNRTKEDLTSVTMAQIVFEQEKKSSRMNLRTLRELVRQGGERAAQLVEETQAELRGRVEAVRQAAEQHVQSLLERGQQTSDRAKELVAASQEAVAQFQRRVDDRVRATMEGMNSLSDLRRELIQLSDRVAELERKLDRLR